MQAILDAGPPFTAENRPQTRITVLNVNPSDHSTHTWDITPSSGPVGNRAADKLPIWWYMDDEFSAFDNALEIPGIKQVVIDRQLLQGAATIQVEIYNTATPANGSAGPNDDTFGDPGHLAYARGLYADGNSRWNFTANEWQNQLRENALLYVWQGYGGEDLPIANAIADGYLILDGVFLVDTCAIEAQTGLITLTGRDMGKLLVDQYAWPPVVPQAFYGAGGNNAGITYYITGQGPYDPAVPGYGTGPNQTVWASQRIVAMGADGLTNGCTTPAELVAFANDSEQLSAYQNTSSDATNGAINACNGDVSTEWISPTKGAATDFTYIQFACGEEINGLYLDPYLPGVMCYVSIIENGEWVDGAGMVNGGTLVGTIPYVANFGLGTAQTSTNSTDTTQGRWYPLPLTYTASVVQLTFTNLQEPQPGDFAAGLIGDCALGQTQSITGTTKTILDISPTPDGGGYRLFGTDGGVFDYGDSIYFGSLAGQALNGQIIGGDGTSDNQGYWMCGADGGIYTFGDAVFYGSLGGETLTAPIVAFRSTPSGNGYYMCGSDGAVYCFGDASYQGRQTGVSNIVDMTIHPDNGGYWLLGATGSVYSFGDVAYHGGLNTLTPDPVTELGTTAVAIDSSGTGDGYRIATAIGGVYTFGDAVYYPITGTTDGTIPSPLNSPITGMRRTPDDLGYWLVGGDGGVFTFGDALFIGALPASFALSGSYTDYCLDEETEILTKRGWLHQDQLEAGDEVLGVDQESGKGAWHSVHSVYRKQRHREMVRFKGASFDALTTPDHRWLTRFGENHDKLHWTTSDVMSGNDHIPLVVPPDHLPTEAKYSDDFVRLVAWFWTEGSWKQYGAQFSQSMNVNPENTLEILQTIKNLYGEPGLMRYFKNRHTSCCGVCGKSEAHYHKENCWSMSVRDDSQHLFNLSSKVAKELHAVMDEKKAVSTGFLLALTKTQLLEYIDISMKADGHCRKDGYRAITQREQSRIKSFEIACALAGVPCVVHERSMAGKPAWTAFLLKQDYIAPIRSAAQQGRATVTREMYEGIVWCPQTELGTFIARRNGSVYLTGNCDIVADMLLWAGFWLYPKSTDGVVPSNQAPLVYGNIETTGAYNSIGPIQGTFDKLQLIDVINQLSSIVGYCFRVDEEGAARWSSPNWWSPGNFLDDGTYTTQLPVLDERINLNDYTQTTTDQTTVSQIIVSPVDPYLFGGDPAAVTVTNFIPSGIGNLHGIRKPAMIGTVLNVPITLTDQEVMAELLAIQCYFASRQGQAVAIHNPAICVDDQIQIYERSSAEANTHYVVGVHIEHDLDSGQKLATYSTYWLGSSSTWAVNANADSILAGSQAQNLTYNTNGILVSDQLINFLANTGAKSVQQLIAGATAPTLINPGGPAATSSDIIDPSTIIAEGISP
jgi:hypothetical protein